MHDVVSSTLGTENRELGLKQIDNEDGLTAPATLGERVARVVKSAAGKGRYIYFVVDDSFKASDTTNFQLEIQYFDAAPGTLSVEFDGSDENAPFSGAYTRAPENAHLEGAKLWRTSQFTLKGAKFGNGQNRSADFRLVIEAPEFAVGSVKLSR